MGRKTIRIGTAGWSIASALKPLFPGEGTHLERYAQRFDAVEINSSFYRPHRRETYERWAASTPPGFRFAVKLPKAVTHEMRLVGAESLIERFAGESDGLGDKLGVVLVQLPPTLIFDASTVGAFLRLSCDHIRAPLAIEPRHPSWFDEDADALLADQGVARVAADPARVPAAEEPGGWRGLSYYRLHGSPDIYRSSYADRIPKIAQRLRGDPADCWCIFDNSASMAAIPDAVALATLLS